jgi:uncharacterized protein with HEPN domain
MTARDARAFLDDIIDAIDLLRRLVEGRTLETYRSEEPLRWAVERGLEIVSEASRHVPAEAKARHAHLPWQQIADIGNRLRHGYHTIDDAIIWSIVQNDLAPLDAAVRAIRADLE